MMAKCSNCSAKNANFKCGLCEQEICKSCTEFLDAEAFHYSDEKPFESVGYHFCIGCYGNHVEPTLISYQEILEKAHDVRVFDKSQSKETRLMKRLEKPIKVQDCSDQHDVTLKLAFIAAKNNFNAILDVDVRSEKVRINGYQTSLWRGTGIPINLSESKLEKDRLNKD